MFELLQPEGDEDGQKDFYEGLPLVRLPDSAEEGLCVAERTPGSHVRCINLFEKSPIAYLTHQTCLFERTMDSDTPLRIRGALPHGVQIPDEESSDEAG